MLGKTNGRASALRLYARHAATIVVVMLIAACSGGGCSSCSGCGIGTLTRPIDTANLIDNAGSLRLTRSGLDFLASSAPTLANKFLTLGTNGEYQYPLALSPDTIDGIDLTFCPSGPNATSNPEECTLDVGIGTATFHVDAVTPSAISVSGTLPVRLQDLPIAGSYSGVITFGQTVTLTLHVGLGANGSCDDTTGDPVEPEFAAVPFTITLPLVADTIAPRVGFTKIDAANIAVNIGVTKDDIEVCANCNLGPFDLSSVCDDATNGIVDLAFSTIESTLQKDITSAVAGALCTTPDTTGACPAGSALDTTTGNCDYTAQPGTCLPLGLGVEGLFDFGSLLSKISYGTTSKLDLALAAGGTMIPANAPTAPAGSPADNVGYTGHTPNGVTLGMLGALVPDPLSACVPKAANPIPTGIPIPIELEQNTESPWFSTDPSGPQFGLALAGRYLNYALGSIYNSGGLCIGLSTESFSELSSGTLTLLAPSIKDLTFEQGNAAAAITTRPQNPPTIAIGGGTDIVKDPLLTINLKEFAIDFYIFSDDSFVRIFTFTTDLAVPLNLSTAVTATNPNGELAPTIGTPIATNSKVTNSELLLEDPAKISAGLSGLLGTIVSQAAGAINPISLASLTSSFGINLTIPADGIRKLTSGSDDFLAIFGDLSLPPSPMVKIKPQAQIVSKDVHPEVMTLATYDAKRLPTLHVTLGTEGGAEPGTIEYTYWIDQGARAPWSTETELAIQNQTLFLQGHHVLHVSAREVGKPLSEGTTPVDLPYLIDVVPPTMTLQQSKDGASLTAWDFVSDQAHLEGRTRITEASGTQLAWSDWQPLAELAKLPAPPAGGSLAAEVRDEAGNVATNEVALIRGQNDAATVAGSCGCSTPGANSKLGPRESWLVVLGGLGLLVALRRLRRTSPRAATTPLEPVRRESRGSVRGRRPGRTTFVAATALGVTVVTGSLSQGCSCGSNNNNFADAAPDAHKKDAKDDTGVDSGMTGCGSDCNQPCGPALPEGIIGAYTSIAKASDGTIWVAGYDDSAVSPDFSGAYGDLVVGKYDSTKKQVEWKTVDGVTPIASGTCPTNDPTGWRQGNTDPGPDVGLWTSIQLDANDHPIVSYFDATNRALKFASSTDGKTWAVHTVMHGTAKDIGRYSKLLVVKGVPVLAFLIMEPGDSGKLRSRVELATGKTATPSAASDWTFEDAAVDDDGPCRPADCVAPAMCIKETNTCSPPSTACVAAGADGGSGDAGSGAACASGLTCVAGFDAGPSCGTVIVGSSYIEIYPNAFGDYIAMAESPTTSNGVGIVVYDRIHGALNQVAKVSGTWQVTVLDSETGARSPNPGADGGITPAETGDVGVGASLFITTTGDWHISYVNGTTEALQYLMVPGGTGQPAAPEIVDNGYTLSGAPFTDGQHIVGDDSSIQVDGVGNVTISYQDSTAGTLHVATGMPEAGGGHTWAVLAASQPNKTAGFFSHSIAGNTSSFANFWRTSDQTTSEETGNVSFVSP